jgi:hypothetical protein
MPDRCFDRARSCGEPRGTLGIETVSRPGIDGAPSQVTSALVPRQPELPKLMAPHVRLRRSCKQLPHGALQPAEALPNSFHGALRWGDTARTSVRKPGRMERLLPSARWRRPTKPKLTCLYSSPASAHASASGTAVTK